MNRSDCSFWVIFFEEPALAFFLAGGFFNGDDRDSSPAESDWLVF